MTTIQLDSSQLSDSDLLKLIDDCSGILANRIESELIKPQPPELGYYMAEALSVIGQLRCHYAVLKTQCDRIAKTMKTEG